jgi:hypothetical protein
MWRGWGVPFKIVDNDLIPFRVEVAKRIAALINLVVNRARTARNATAETRSWAALPSGNRYIRFALAPDAREHRRTACPDLRTKISTAAKYSNDRTI